MAVLKLRTALDSTPPSAATRERFGLKRALHEPDTCTVVRIVWSAGDDDEHAWFWSGLNARGRTLASDYSHIQDEDAVLVAIGEQGAHVADDVAWETELTAAGCEAVTPSPSA